MIHGLSPLAVGPQSVVLRLDRQPDVSVRRAMLLVAGELVGQPESQTGLAGRAAPDDAATECCERLLALYREEPDPGIHAAAEWTLRRFGQDDELARSDQQLTSAVSRGDRQWYVNGQGQTLVVLPGPTQFLMGIAGRAMPDAARRSAAQPADPPQLMHRQQGNHGRAVPAVSGGTTRPWLPTRAGSGNWLPDRPQTAVTWYQAAAYCNWLSQQEGVPRDQWCYVPNAAGAVCRRHAAAAGLPGRRGYRLPTEAEWEYACRAGADTSHACGDAATYLSAYACFGVAEPEQPRPVGAGSRTTSGCSTCRATRPNGATTATGPIHHRRPSPWQQRTAMRPRKCLMARPVCSAAAVSATASPRSAARRATKTGPVPCEPPSASASRALTRSPALTRAEAAGQDFRHRLRTGTFIKVEPPIFLRSPRIFLSHSGLALGGPATCRRRGGLAVAERRGGSCGNETDVAVPEGEFGTAGMVAAETSDWQVLRHPEARTAGRSPAAVAS